MREQARENKKAWEYRAYEHWSHQGSPREKAAAIQNDPMACLKAHQAYFQDVRGLKIANPCGSNGRKAVPLALLGADVTVFDISEENRRYALELAACAGVSIGYEVGDFCETDIHTYGGAFDMVYAEGGVLHYFSDIDAFTGILYAVTKANGTLILSDFHPFRKTDRENPTMLTGGVHVTGGDYFDSRVHEGELAYRGFFAGEEQDAFPKCLLRHYTLSEIINSVIGAGFAVKEFQEHPSRRDGKLPGEFTLVAAKP